MAGTNNYFDMIYFFCAAFLIILYIFTIIVLIINHKIVPFNSSFFVIWINLGVMDVIVAISFRLFSTDPGVDWLLWSNLMVCGQS
jgi:hypothetical protein